MIGPLRITKHLLVSVTSVSFKKSCQICQTETIHAPLKVREDHNNIEIRNKSSIVSFLFWRMKKKVNQEQEIAKNGHRVNYFSLGDNFIHPILYEMFLFFVVHTNNHYTVYENRWKKSVSLRKYYFYICNIYLDWDSLKIIILILKTIKMYHINFFLKKQLRQ